MLKYNMNNFERVLISSIYNRTRRVEVHDFLQYYKQKTIMDKKGCGGICEIVGLEEIQVKSIFWYWFQRFG